MLCKDSTGEYSNRRCSKTACVLIDSEPYCWQHAKNHLPDIEVLTVDGKRHLKEYCKVKKQ